MAHITKNKHNAIRARLLDVYLHTSMTCKELAHYNNLLELAYNSQDDYKGYRLDVSPFYEAIVLMIDDLYPVRYAEGEDDLTID